MSFKKIILLALIVIAFPLSYKAQSWKFYRHEIHFGLGASNFLGELGGADRIGTNGLRDLEFTLSRPTIEAAYHYVISPYFKARANLLYGRIKGDDRLTSEPFRNNRNLHFRSPIAEFSLQIQYFPFKEKITHLYRIRGTRGKKTSFLSPYLSAGIGAFYFNPRGKYTDGKWYSLQPLGTEGQGLPGGPKKYSRFQVCLPVGIGLNYALNKVWSIGLELNARVTFTDYIDDVSTTYYDNAAILTANGPVAAYFADPSNHDPNLIAQSGSDPTTTGFQRGDLSDKDRYMFAIFSVHYRFLKGRMHMPKF